MDHRPKITIEAYGQSKTIVLVSDHHRSPEVDDPITNMGELIVHALDRMEEKQRQH